MAPTLIDRSRTDEDEKNIEQNSGTLGGPSMIESNDQMVTSIYEDAALESSMHRAALV